MLIASRSTALPAVIVLAASISAAACAPAATAASDVPPQRLTYTITPRSMEDRTDLHVTLRYRGNADGQTLLNLPRDKYGTPNVHEAVTSIIAHGDATIGEADDMRQRIVTHAPSAPVELTYVISWTPARSEGYAYSPNVTGDRFHFFGPQWIVWPAGYEGPVDLSVEFADLPEGWHVLSSFGIGPGPHDMSHVALDDLTSFIAGGAYRVHDFACERNPVRVGVGGDFDLDDDAIFDNVERIVCAERNWMDDHSQPFFTVGITTRDGIRAGTDVANAFVCMLDPQVSARPLNILLAHEMFHYWMPGQARVTAEDFDDDVGASTLGYQWVDEGFTEYFARKILNEVGLLTRDELVQLTNQDFEDYIRNVHRHIPYAELRRAAEERRFTGAHQRIGYYRGALIALDWDATIQQETDGEKSLSDAMREVVRASIERGGHLPEAQFHEIMSRYGIDSEQAFERYIIRGETPPSNPDAYAPDYVLDEKIMYDFAPGFNLAASREQKLITGIDPEGHAHAVGLRDGMELIDTDNSRSYDPQEPMRVTVRVDGEQRTFEYFPKGDSISVPVFRRAGGK